MDNVARRLPQARQAASGYRQYFQSAQQLFDSGLGNLLDLETARRNQLNAELAIKSLEHEQVSAWIALYRAVGGGWDEAGQSSASGAPIAGALGTR